MGRTKGSKNKAKYGIGKNKKDEDKTFFTEFASYFKEESRTKAADLVSELFLALKLTQQKLFGKCKSYNARFEMLDILSQLIIMCFFNCKNPYQFGISTVRRNIGGCGKSTLCNFKNNDYINWRFICGYIFKKIWTQFILKPELKLALQQSQAQASNFGTNNQSQEDKPKHTVMVVDDTDLEHWGPCLEYQGNMFSHTKGKLVKGHKCLLITVNDGTNSFIYDFFVVGEKGKKGDQGLTEEQQNARYSKKRNSDCPMSQRVNEYKVSKMILTKNAIEQAIKDGIDFEYFESDSWFGCPSLAFFLLDHKKHFLGMTKKTKTKYVLTRGETPEDDVCLDANGLIERFKKGDHKHYDRSLKYHYIELELYITRKKTIKGKKGKKEEEVEYAPIKMFFVKGAKRNEYKAIFTTDTSLNFKQVAELYGYRWSIEVTIRDMKQNLGLAKCQSRNFSAHIAHVSICVLQYNLMSLAKRYNNYKTIGGLFKEAQKDFMELTVLDRIRILIWEMIDNRCEIFGSDTDEEEVLTRLCDINPKFKTILDSRYRICS